MFSAMRRFPLSGIAVLVGLLAVASPAAADCTDPAAPGVAWRRCLLTEDDFRQVDLTGAVLRETTFERSVLDGATLTDSDAYRVKFINASLRGTALDGARLMEADFTRADLTGATLRGADLRSTQFVNAILQGADLSGANILRAIFRNADLSGATWTDGKVCAAGSIGRCVAQAAAPESPPS
jgi:uncharacterized protein YjbI with pentapeptide repeats